MSAFPRLNELIIEWNLCPQTLAHIHLYQLKVLSNTKNTIFYSGYRKHCLNAIQRVKYESQKHFQLVMCIFDVVEIHYSGQRVFWCHVVAFVKNYYTGYCDVYYSYVCSFFIVFLIKLVKSVFLCFNQNYPLIFT